jgi:hypothetical protein
MDLTVFRGRKGVKVAATSMTGPDEVLHIVAAGTSSFWERILGEGCVYVQKSMSNTCVEEMEHVLCPW